VTKPPHRKSVADLDTFITMLRTACVDETVNDRLQKLLSLPDSERQGLVHTWVTDLVVAGAPRDFIEAIACLHDNDVAEKAYEVIYECKREGTTRNAESRAWKIAIALLVVVSLACLAWLIASSTRPAPGAKQLDPHEAYRTSVRTQLRKTAGNLTELQKFSGRSAKVLLRINFAGEIERVQLLNSSGDNFFDDLSLLMAMKAGPFPLPSELRQRMNRLKAEYILFEHVISGDHPASTPDANSY
jgi:hypothetical protein